MGPGLLGGGLEVTGPGDLRVMAHWVKPLQCDAGLPLLWLWEEEVCCSVPGEEKVCVGHQEVGTLCQFDRCALRSLEEGTQSQSKEACCTGRLNVGVREGWSAAQVD